MDVRQRRKGRRYKGVVAQSQRKSVGSKQAKNSPRRYRISVDDEDERLAQQDMLEEDLSAEGEHSLEEWSMSMDEEGMSSTAEELGGRRMLPEGVDPSSASMVKAGAKFVMRWFYTTLVLGVLRVPMQYAMAVLQFVLTPWHYLCTGAARFAAWSDIWWALSRARGGLGGFGMSPRGHRGVARTSVPADIRAAVLRSACVTAAVEEGLNQKEKNLSFLPMTSAQKKRRAERLKAAGQMLDVMAARPSMAVVRIMCYILRKVWRFVYVGGVHVVPEELQELKRIARDRPLVLLPTHKSHLDYVLLMHLCFEHNLPMPVIAAGDNLNLPIVGGFLRRCGAFFIRRSFKRDTDPLYTVVFKEYVKQMLGHGYSFECFIEGGRSRTGKVLMPRSGALGAVIEAVQEGIVDDAQVVPISISYDRIAENNAHLAELSGEKKKKERLIRSLRSVLGFVANAINNVQCYGRVDIRIGTTFSARTFLSQRRERRSGSTTMGPVLHTVSPRMGSMDAARAASLLGVTPGLVDKGKAIVRLQKLQKLPVLAHSQSDSIYACDTVSPAKNTTNNGNKSPDASVSMPQSTLVPRPANSNNNSSSNTSSGSAKANGSSTGHAAGGDEEIVLFPSDSASTDSRDDQHGGLAPPPKTGGPLDVTPSHSPQQQDNKQKEEGEHHAHDDGRQSAPTLREVASQESTSVRLSRNVSFAGDDAAFQDSDDEDDHAEGDNTDNNNNKNRNKKRNDNVKSLDMDSSLGQAYSTHELGYRMGYRVLYEANRVYVVLPASMVATTLLTTPYTRAVDHDELVRRVFWVRDQIRSRGGHVADLEIETIDMTVQSVLGSGSGRSTELVKQFKHRLMVNVYNPKERMALSLYRNQLIHIFVGEAIVACAYYAFEKQAALKARSGIESQWIPMSELKEASSFLSQLFQFEFIFRPSSGLDENFAAAVNSLVKRGTCSQRKSPTDGNVQITVNESEEALTLYLFLCRLLWAYIDSYWLMALSFFHLLPNRAIAETMIIEKAQQVGETLYFQGQTDLYESINKETLQNALSVFDKFRVIEFVKVEGFSGDLSRGNRIVRLRQDYQQRHMIKHLVRKLSKFRKRARQYRSRWFKSQPTDDTQDSIATALRMVQEEKH